MKALCGTLVFLNNNNNMRKGFLIVICFMGFSQLAAACDICGCGVGSYYIGILPEFQKRFIGMRYQQKGLLTHLRPDGEWSYLTTDETYKTMELWGAWNVGNRFRVVGFVPYNFIERKNQGVRYSKQGLGDVAVVGYYNVLKSEYTTDSTFKRVIHTLWIGGGAKLPTGSYDPAGQRAGVGEQNTFQLGTKSFDFTLNAMYDLRIQDVGLNTNVSYKINTVNDYQYQYGNKLTANVLGYYKFRVAKQTTLAPNTGVLYETAATDRREHSRVVEESGGHTLMGIAGTEVSLKRIAFGVNYQVPLSQDLARGQVRANNRLMVHMSLGF